MADSCAAAGRIPTHVLPLDKSVVGNGHVEIRDVALSHLKVIIYVLSVCKRS